MTRRGHKGHSRVLKMFCFPNLDGDDHRGLYVYILIKSNQAVHLIFVHFESYIKKNTQKKVTRISSSKKKTI